MMSIQERENDPFQDVELGAWSRIYPDTVVQRLPPRNVWQALNGRTQAVYISYNKKAEPGRQWYIDDPSVTANHPSLATFEAARKFGDEIVNRLTEEADRKILAAAGLNQKDWSVVVDPSGYGTERALRFERLRRLGVMITFQGAADSPLDGTWLLSDIDGETRSYPTVEAAGAAGTHLVRFPSDEPDDGIRKLGRIVARPGRDGAPGRILGECFQKQPEDGLKPGRVYELRSVFGDFQLVDVGPSALGETAGGSLIEGANWNTSAGTILDAAGENLTLTRDEFEQLHGTDTEDGSDEPSERKP